MTESVLTKVTRNGQLTIPKTLRDRLGIEEGDYIEVVMEDNRVILTPKKLIDADQAYFWTKSWQEGEREASADIAAGRVTGFEDVEDAIASLRKEREDR